MATGRAAGHREEPWVAAEIMDVGSSPCRGSAHVTDMTWPPVPRGDPVLHRYADPSLLSHMRHQAVTLKLAPAVQPPAARHEHQHRRGTVEVATSPHIQNLLGRVAVGH